MISLTHLLIPSRNDPNVPSRPCRLAQSEISSGELLEGREPLPGRDELVSVEDDNRGRVPVQEDDLPTIETERPLLPDWLQNPENEVVEVGGANSTIFTKG